MHVVKTALRESFDNIHVGFLYSSKDETIKIETNRGKIGGEKMLLIYIPHVGELLPFRHIHSDSNHTLPPRSPPRSEPFKFSTEKPAYVAIKTFA